MESERALQRLEEVRSLVDDNTAELVDAVAKVVMLQQDMRSPMLGAKVTLWLRPPHTDYSEAEIVDPEDAPDPDSDKWNWQWAHYEKDGEQIYKFQAKENPDDPDLVPHKAIVIEGNISGSAPEGKLWDPNKREYKTAEDYPLGTVNCVVGQEHNGDDLVDFEDDYPTDVAVYTSITPANGGDPAAHEYTPGWE